MWGRRGERERLLYLVAVDNTHAAVERHVDGHLRLGDRVHRGRHKRQVQSNLPRHLRLGGGVGGEGGESKATSS